ncbi:MAG: DUF6062 family protein [Armatimonadota bacterium]|nr:DUF6062 family protein [Armatimonadota bacterium]MDR7435837.1 DUF6062 family protein [Armatimonadota bacterium]
MRIPRRQANQKKAIPGDDLIFVKVREALSFGGCPICWLANRAAQRFLDGFLYERVNDPGARKEFLTSRGFCLHHAWALQQFYDAFGVAIVYRHLLQELLQELRLFAERTPISGFRRDARESAARLRSALLPKRACPACEVARSTEETALAALLERLNDLEVQERLSTTSWLCLPHFQMGVAIAREATQIRRLAQIQVEVLQNIVGSLGEFIRKHDYRFSHEPITEEEATSWAQAIQMVVGRDPMEVRIRRR